MWGGAFAFDKKNNKSNRRGMDCTKKIYHIYILIFYSETYISQIVIGNVQSVSNSNTDWLSAIRTFQLIDMVAPQHTSTSTRSSFLSQKLASKVSLCSFIKKKKSPCAEKTNYRAIMLKHWYFWFK